MTPRKHNMTPKTIRLVAALVAFAIAAPLSAAPPKVMPKYRGIIGEPITDPVKIKYERKVFERAFRGFRTAARDYRNDVRELISDEILRRQKKVAKQFQNQIDEIEKIQFKLRKEAIARLEGFIFRHREHDRYTPDALFRLAELYYEDSIAEYNNSQDNFDRDMDLYNRGKLLDPPSEKDKDFSRSIALYKYLHWVPAGTRMPALSGKLKGVVLPKRWPNYRHADASLYLQGYCEAEMQQIDRAIATLSSLEKHYPKSKYIAEAWLRVGEMYFDDNEFEDAARAYKHAADTKDPKMYGLALYKLGWAYFQMYRYPVAVGWFQKLIEYYDNNPETLKKGAQSQGLRKEAIEYLAKSLAEPSWDDDACEDFGGEDSKDNPDCPQVDPRLRPRLYVSGVLEPKFEDFPDWMSLYAGDALNKLQTQLKYRQQVRAGLMSDKGYVREVLVTYATALIDQAEDEYYRQAILVLRYIVAKWPMARDAQALQKKIIQAVDLLAAAAPGLQIELDKNPNNAEAKLAMELTTESMDAQITERRNYLKNFSKGSPWYNKWGNDKDLAAQVEEMVAKVRLNFAQLVHAQAQTFRAAGQEEKALQKYAEAAKEYEILLQSDLDAKKAYELAWTLADVLFFAGRRCDALRNKEGDVLIGPDGNAVAYPAEVAAKIKEACGSMYKSVKYYNMVRDWKGVKGKDEDDKPLDYTEEAAFSSIIATERILVAKSAFPADDPDRLPTRIIPEIRPSEEQDEADAKKNEKSVKVVRVERMELPQEVVDWLLAVDGYIAAGRINKDNPNRIHKLALKAAELLYKNRHFDPWEEKVDKDKGITAEFWSARKRFWAIMRKWPKSSQAAEAVKNLLTSFEIERDFKELQTVTDYVEKVGIGSKEQIKRLKAAIKVFSLGVLARHADQLYKEANDVYKQANESQDPDEAFRLHEKARKSYAAAAAEFRSLRKQTDKTQTKLQTLMNGQLLYRRAEMWDKALATLDEAEKMLEEINADPKTKAKEKKENSKRLITVIKSRAELQFQFFRIPEALANYRRLYELDRDGKEGKNALLNSANLAFSNSNWQLALDLYTEIIKRFEGQKKFEDRVYDAWYKRPIIYKNMNQTAMWLKKLDEYIAHFKNDPKVTAKVFRAHRDIARHWRQMGQTKKEFKRWNLVLKEFAKNEKTEENGTGLWEKNGGPEATVAAEAEFWLLEPRYKKFLSKKLTENKRLSPTRRMKSLQDQVKKMTNEAIGTPTKVKNPQPGQPTSVRKGGLYNVYLERVATYGSQNWSYAAFLYRAKVLQHMARTIYAAPTPEDLSEDEEEQLMEILETIGAQFENRALKSLEVAVQDADKKGVVNEWVTKLRAAINKYKPAEYPLLKEAHRMIAEPDGVAPAPEKELR